MRLFFYAKKSSYNKAITKAKKGYDYVTKVQGQNTLPVFYQLLNLAEVEYISKQYKKAVEYGEQGLAIVNKKIKSGTSSA